MVTDQLTVKSGYKITSLGCIPCDWNIIPLSKLCQQISDGTHHTPHYIKNGVPFYSVENITRRDFENTKFISREDHLQLIKRCKPERGDILMTRITAGIVGDTQLIDWDVDASIYVSLALLKPNEYIHSNYFYQYTKSKAFLSSVEKFALVNASPKKINLADIGKIEILVPPSIAEQESIAKSLADMQELIDSLEKVTKKKQNIKQGAMQELLTGKRRLSGFNKKWDFDEIQNHANITTGSKNTQDKIENGRYPFFVRSKKIERINTYSFDGESVVTAGDGDIGKIFHYIDGKFDFHQRVYKISYFDDLLDGYFFYLYFKKYFLKRVMSLTAKSTVDSIRMEMIAEMLIPLPEKKEQLEIGKILRDMDSEIEQLEAKRDKYIMIKNGMMQKLLTGEIRLT